MDDDDRDAVWSNSGVDNCCDQSRLVTEAIGACKAEVDKLSTKVARYTTRQCPGSQTAFHQPIVIDECKRRTDPITRKRTCKAKARATCCARVCFGPTVHLADTVKTPS